MNELVEIKNRIFMIRGVQVMLDKDLAEFYRVDTKSLNRSVKRNIKKFPKEFMFQLTKSEKEEVVPIWHHLPNLKYSSQLPYVFTEQGVAMLAGILKSDRAVKISIEIINAFILMKKIVSSNSLINLRLDNIEKKHLLYDSKFEEIFSLMNKNEFKQGVFFEGQIFDSYSFISDLIRSAKHTIILIDNYIDDSVLKLFIKKSELVKVKIYTKKINSILLLDIQKFKAQYFDLEILEFNKFHDRFMIIDGEVYHIGASLKDLGTKWFAFSKLKEDYGIIKRLI